MATSGMNLRDALKEWRDLGGNVRAVKGTDEAVLWTPLLPGRRARVKITRKDSGRVVTVMIRRLREVLGR